MVSRPSLSLKRSSCWPRRLRLKVAKRRRTFGFDLVRTIARLQEDSGQVVDLEMARFEADYGDTARALSLARSGLSHPTYAPCRRHVGLGFSLG